MKRRNFIWLLTAGAGGVAAGGYVFFENFESLVRKILIKDTSSLNISAAEIDKYLLASRKNKSLVNGLPFPNQQLLKWHYYLDNPLFSLPYNTKYTVDRSRIVGDFLLATDFFNNKMDTKKPVKYIDVYDPYQKPCSNPFSNLFYPDA
ncbi:hypothetical protein [Agriterribacter sp.]|uniref:hypothetical protein n=1 Tax=Agriterribacter sp. TaxID=2821509 RepID=UPI002B534281|nr:hypothetical protein [Agriterribacter sp.]HTN07993.1 hypothetical protein [Agriterribacter sp.]